MARSYAQASSPSIQPVRYYRYSVVSGRTPGWASVHGNVTRAEAYNRLRMKFMNRLKARRRQKAHERYLQERERQRLLSETDTEEAIRDAATNWNAGGQSETGPSY